MAYMDQEKKKIIAPAVKEICARHGMKATLAVHNHSSLVLTLAEGPIDFGADRVPDRWSADRLAQDMTRGETVNPYSYSDAFTGAALAFLAEVFPALNAGNHDRSDSMTDYFDVGWYVDIKIGRWDKPYRLTGSPIVAAPPPPAPSAPPVVAASPSPAGFVIPPPFAQRLAQA
jgi:hypothetical protein